MITEFRVEIRTTTRRTFLGLSLTLPLGAALTACGSDGPSPSSGGGGGKPTATIWYLTGQPAEGVRKASAERFNKANPDAAVKVTLFENDAYKTKIKTAIGAGQAPTLIFGWGGGTLRSYVQAGQVDDLTPWLDENPQIKDKLLESTFSAGVIDDKVYGLPTDRIQPIVLFYNKRVFDKVGVEPPQTWGDVLDLVPKFNAAGVAPFSLAGQSRWTNMMWLEFLFDRIGGPEVFQAVYDGEKNAWSHPDAIKALTEVQKLVKMNAFVKGFSSIVADQDADQALLFTDKAAMMLHGSWTYGSMKSNGGDFVTGGHLGYMNFPPVDGGKGDPSNTFGNPAQYLSIYSKATPEQKEIAKRYLASLVTDEEAKAWIDVGSLPVLKGTESLLAQSPDADFLKFTYDIANNAKHFGQSWDQALSPTAAEVLLDNIAKLFQLSISPQQFAENMNQVIGK
ncbi:carbohydrate ABC transporter substrate-binding protein (CUT1 family) [Thermopolyspora flexuosa]|uniref:Carbohydrate ABC transporter substrate-binding protein (CUT1 family) n=1 Tax=Thermopolyspora flexuosa TaxID=103836 RepID=A0A543IW92_9ACTN|nr:carbohydrate ABC transporter substrate-binding protein (CUT1 family) [Thermopolyspora flexuosa]